MSASGSSAASERRANAQPTMSVREMAHRINNTLAVVQAIITQTARLTGDPADFVDAVSRRIAAMAVANRSLLNGDHDGSDLETLVRQELEMQGAASTRLSLRGPRAALPSRSVVSFALVIHELATNAVKYGALSNDTGTVEMTWSVAPDSDARDMLSFLWRERGGPPVAPPRRKGFGSIVLERGLDDCKVSRSFEPEGLTCGIALPL